MLVLIVLVLALNVAHLRAYDYISPFDEYAHVDSVDRGSRGQVIVQPDDQLGQETLREVACRGSEFIPALPRCRPGRYDPTEFVYRGWNQASAHSPWYYVATGLGVRALRALPGPGGLVTWARVLGSAWLLLGLYLTLRAADGLGLPRGPTLAALVMVAAVPAVLHASTTVNPDTSGMVGGAAVLLAVLAWERDGRSLWLPALGAFVCATLDTTNAVAVIAAAAYLGLRALDARREPGETSQTNETSETSETSEGVRTPGDHLRAVLAMGAGAGVGVFGWKAVYALLTPRVDLSGHPSQRIFDVDHLELETVVGRDTVFGIFPPFEGHVPTVLGNTAYLTFVGAAVLVAIGALLSVTFGARLSERVGTLGAATLIGLLVSAPVLVLYNYVADGLYFPILTRQALSAVPALALVIASVATRRPGRVLVTGVAVGLYATALGALL